MKLCACCHNNADDGDAVCSRCGEASWLGIQLEPAPAAAPDQKRADDKKGQRR